MRLHILGLLVGSLLLLALPGRATWAGDIALTDEDCIKLLERWAADPSSVPANLVEPCRHQVENIGTPQVDVPARFDPKQNDPCSDPQGTIRVDCWGPWAPRIRESYRPVVIAGL